MVVTPAVRAIAAKLAAQGSFEGGEKWGRLLFLSEMALMREPPIASLGRG